MLLQRLQSLYRFDGSTLRWFQLNLTGQTLVVFNFVDPSSHPHPLQLHHVLFLKDLLLDQSGDLTARVMADEILRWMRFNMVFNVRAALTNPNHLDQGWIRDHLILCPQSWRVY